MSVAAIRAALESALAAVTPTIATAWENAEFTPTPGTPYQRVYVLFAEPANTEISRSYMEQGFMQVSLAYPLNGGPGPAAARAELLRSIFYRGRSLLAAGVTTTIERTPEIAPGQFDGDRYVVPVRIRFFAHIPV